MKIGLIDVDSKIPNLALMKISAYWKKRNLNDVWLIGELDLAQMDIVYASKIFDYSVDPNFPKWIETGGTGYAIDQTLPLDIEECFPDYSLYDCDYAIGFTSRGCNRNCPWCIVPQKEGSFRITGDIGDFWDGQDRIMILDSSMNTNEDHFLEVCEELVLEEIKVDFNQGLDIRYLTSTQADVLNRVKLWKKIHFAWDSISYEKAVMNGIEILDSLAMKYKSMFYILIGFDTDEEEDLYRVEKLRELKVDPFVMPYNKFDNYQRRFARWVNHKAVFKSVKWADYKE